MEEIITMEKLDDRVMAEKAANDLMNMMENDQYTISERLSYLVNIKRVAELYLMTFTEHLERLAEVSQDGQDGQEGTTGRSS